MSEFDVIGHVFSNGTLTLTVNGEVFTVHESDAFYPEVWEVMDNPDLSASEKASEIKDILKPTPKPLKVEIPHYEVGDIEVDRYGSVFIEGRRVDDPVTRKISEMHQAGLSFGPLVAFMNKVALNPDPGVREQLFRFLNVSGFPLSEDGDFLGYKGVKHDLWDKHTGNTYQYNPGAVVSMARDQVCSDPDRGCAAGIHVGSFEYAEDFASVVILVKVDPSNVVSVPHDYSYQKLRACEVTVARVVATTQRLTRPVYADDDLDIEDDEEWAANEEEAETLDRTVEVSIDRMSRDALCRHAGTTEHFDSAEEARFMGKKFVREVLNHGGFDFPKSRKKDLRKLLDRRRIGYSSRETFKDLVELCASEP